MVCTGNICRSPMAALISRAHLRRAGVAARVDSAGTHGYHVGEPADRRARSVLREAGYPQSHSARQFRAEWLAQRDLVLAMDTGHAEFLRRLALRNALPAESIELIRSYDKAAVAAGDLDVPDPYYDTIAEFRAVRDMLESAMPGLIRRIRELC
ncbi:MAG: low molecular weight protein-tyrosine-phosphatase [Candidatus Nanopelagicales bacterium]